MQDGPRFFVPQTITKLDSVWASENTCLQWLERILREHDQSELADKLPECHIVLKCRRPSLGTAPSGFKRARSSEVVVATVFLEDKLADALAATESEDLLFFVTPPAPARPALVRDATAQLMRASTGLRLPDRKDFKRMTGQHELYNSVIDYLERDGLGWGAPELPQGRTFVEHVCNCFWVLTPKVCQVPQVPQVSLLCI